jgi:hypothetical protein
MSTLLDRKDGPGEIRQHLDRQPLLRPWRTTVRPTLRQRRGAQHAACADVEATALATPLKQDRKALTG